MGRIISASSNGRKVFFGKIAAPDARGNPRGVTVQVKQNETDGILLVFH
jgi:hypothetical protein